MRPQLLKVTTAPAQSFNVRRDLIPFFNNKWHYHSEIELIYLEKGTGTQFVGDNIKNFNGGDIVLLGPNLPHYWSFDIAQDSSKKQDTDVTVAHFNETFLGEKFFIIPETKMIRDLLERSRRGVQITGDTRHRVADMMKELLAITGIRRLLKLLDILEIIAQSNEINYLSSAAFIPSLQTGEKERINLIYQYSITNFRNKITLDEIASIANISPNSFCRYFKINTGKTFSGFLLEYRVGVACKLLIEDRLSIQQVCYESGFNNFANFYKSFKAVTGKPPLTYQKSFIRKGNA